MTNHPMLFSSPMIKALLARTKTQTRRAVMSREEIDKGPWLKVRAPNADHGWQAGLEQFNSWTSIRVRIKQGDRIWAREAWRTFVSLDKVPPRDLLNGQRGAGVYFEAGGNLALSADGTRHSGDEHGHPGLGKFRQAMHMPRWASRLTLEVTDVRVERLQSISDGDAKAEGLESLMEGDADDTGRARLYEYFRGADGLEWQADPVDAYMALWDSINGEGASDANPWVAAYTFRVEHANIESALA